MRQFIENLLEELVARLAIIFWLLSVIGWFLCGNYDLAKIFHDPILIIMTATISIATSAMIIAFK